MATADDRIKDLIIKHIKDELTIEDQLELHTWINLSDANRDLFSQLTNPETLNKDLTEYHEARINIRKKIEARIQSPSFIELPSPPSRTIWRRMRVYVAAASLLIIFATSYFWLASLFRSPSRAHPASVPVVAQDVVPGGNKATLTLANGSTIVLEDAANGNLTMQGNTHISKEKDLLSYTPHPENPTPSAVSYNTLTTPRSGQFQLLLPDGTKVWLNNATTLRYPTSFSGNSREVELTGEAYFEVAKDNSKPFSVKLHDLTVNVLGTSFNIMAYSDEPVIKATLLTGKISVTAAGRQSILSPGEQALLDHAGSITISKSIDTEEAIAWQRGYFHFTHANVVDVLRQLARWYDVEVVFTIPVPDDYTFDGEIGRDLNLSTILKYLEKKDLHFHIEAKKLIVSR